MNPIIRVLLLFAITSLSINSNSQTVTTRIASDNVAKSQTSTLNNDFEKDVYVDLYTGMLKGSFDIFNYENSSSHLKHKISLNYTGGGIRVDDISSNIGLNWALYTGGIITREVRGLPDEDANGFRNTGAEPTSFTNSDIQSLLDYVNADKDGQYDLYHFVAGDVSGDFIIGKNGHIVTIPSSNIKIEIVSNTGVMISQSLSHVLENCTGSFIITLENGMKYVYGGLDCSEINYFTAPGSSTPNKKQAAQTWYLTKIVSEFDEQEINFTYEPFLREYTINNYTKYTSSPSGSNPNLDFCTGGGNDQLRYQIDYQQRDLRLLSISYPNNTLVSFNYSSFKRLDLECDYALDNILISNGSSTYGYKLSHSYIDRRISPTNPSPSNLLYQDYSNNNPGFGERYYSLQLDGFNKFSGTTHLKGYEFYYNGDGLYKRHGGTTTTSATTGDLWGFANAVSNNSYQGDNNFTSYTNGTYTLSGSSRMPNTGVFAKSLANIKLPEGGRIYISYEQNTTKTSITPNDVGISSMSYIGGIRVSQITYDDKIEHTTQAYNGDRWQTYSYLEEDGITSSGILANFPKYSYEYTDKNASTSYTRKYEGARYCGSGNHQIFGTSDINFIYRSTYPLNDALYTNGSPVGYGRVTVTTNTGKRVYKFTTPVDYPTPNIASANTFPFPNTSSIDYARGQIKEVATYNKTGQLMEKTENQYTYSAANYNGWNFNAVKVGVKADPPVTTSDIPFSFYNPISGHLLLTQSTTTKYYTNGSIQDQQNITYDGTYRVPRYTTSTNASGHTIRTQFYYAFDYDENYYSGVMGLNHSAGNVRIPLTIEKWNLTTGKLLDATITSISTFHGNYNNSIYSGLVKPSAIKKLAVYVPMSQNALNPSSSYSFSDPNWLLSSTISPYFNQLASMDVYDVKGNLLEITDKTIKRSFIYGYNKTLKIAEIDNAVCTDVAYTSFENVGTDASDQGNWTVNNYNSTNLSTGDYVTGKNYYSLHTNESLEKTNLNASIKYVVSFWSNPTSHIVPPPTVVVKDYNNNSYTLTLTPSDVHHGWQLYKATFTGRVSVTISTSGTKKIDEVRLYPEGASMTTYTYDPLFGNTSICDPSNRAIHTEYDAFGRKKYILDLDLNIKKAFDYKQQELY